jgi:hypothetical protein
MKWRLGSPHPNALLFIVLAQVLVAALIGPLVVIPGFVLLLAAGALITVVRATGKSMPISRERMIVLLLFVPYALTVIASAYLDPRGLAAAQLVQRDGTRTCGEVLVNPGPSGGTWYIGRGHGKVRAVGDVVTANVVPSKPGGSRFHKRTLLQIILGRAHASPDSRADLLCAKRRRKATKRGVASPAKPRRTPHPRT